MRQLTQRHQLALQKPTLKKEEVSTEINLKSLLGESSKNESIRQVFFEAAFDKMLARLDQGRGVDGKLHAYSKSYKDSLAFAAFGKSNTVNMQLTGDMVQSVTVLDSSETKLKIGIDDVDQAAKAYGHMTGMKGHPTLDGKVDARNWFGWKDSELIKIADAIKPEINKRDILSDAVVLKLLNKLVG